MIKYDEQHELDSVNGALAIRGEVERVVDAICEKGYDLLCYMGIGGTYASALQVESHLKELSDLPVIVENAAQFNTTGNKRITEKSVVVISSVSGCTSEMVTAMRALDGNRGHRHRLHRRRDSNSIEARSLLRDLPGERTTSVLPWFDDRSCIAPGRVSHSTIEYTLSLWSISRRTIDGASR